MRKLTISIIVGLLALGALAPSVGAKQPATPTSATRDWIVPNGTPQAGQPLTFTWKNRHTQRPTIWVICEQPQAPNGGSGIVYTDQRKEPGAVFPMVPTGAEPFVWDQSQPANCAADLMRNTPNGWVSDARVEFVAVPA